eukprot:12430198-Karenia_brevis.AAC.1
MAMSSNLLCPAYRTISTSLQRVSSAHQAQCQAALLRTSTSQTQANTAQVQAEWCTQNQIKATGLPHNSFSHTWVTSERQWVGATARPGQKLNKQTQLSAALVQLQPKQMLEGM